MPEAPAGSSPLEQYLLLAKSAKGAAAVTLIEQALEAPGVHVFGELLDIPNIAELSGSPYAGHLELLQLFAYGTYKNYDPARLPPLTPKMKRKLQLLSIASMATKSKILKYSIIQQELELKSVRELEDLIIEGCNSSILLGKLDQKNSHFEVDYAMGRDIRKAEVSDIIQTLQQWCESCDGVLACLESQVMRANNDKKQNIDHKATVENKVSEIRNQLKAQQQLTGEGQEDPDSRMDTDRGMDRREKKSKGKGLRGSGKSSFWQK